MKSNRFNNIDLFTHHANSEYKKHIKTQSKAALKFIDTHIDWTKLIAPLEKELPLARRGRKRFDLLVIVKCFILQNMYNLSAPRLEEEIADRRSFQMFLGLVSGDAIPDETTICRYRALFAQKSLDKKLFESFNMQLSERGILLERGTLVDATIKQAQATPSSRRDKDAAHTPKRNKNYYGYKGQVGVDKDSNVIHSTEFTPANIHDSQYFEELISGKEEAVFADKGYANKKRKNRLRATGVYCGILDKGYRGRPLSPTQKRRNQKLSSVRNNVERPFAYLKRVLSYEQCRYYDLHRNRFEFNMKAMVFIISGVL